MFGTSAPLRWPEQGLVVWRSCEDGRLLSPHLSPALCFQVRVRWVRAGRERYEGRAE